MKDGLGKCSLAQTTQCARSCYPRVPQLVSHVERCVYTIAKHLAHSSPHQRKKSLEVVVDTYEMAAAATEEVTKGVKKESAQSSSASVSSGKRDQPILWIILASG